MSLYSSYDQFYQDNPSPPVLGGRSRAIKADRDSLGRFMPDDLLDRLEWRLDPTHGRQGGRKRAATARRERGRFTRS